MQTSPYSSSAWSSSGALSSDSSETSIDRSNVAGLSSLGSDGSWKTRAIAIAVKAHMKLQLEPFAYVYNCLVEQKNCTVVVICCMSRLQDEMGLDRPIDVDSFGGVNKKKLEAEVKTQMINLNHFLREFREFLNRRGVKLDIRVSTGPKSHDILVQAAKALQPHWLVLDCSFSCHKMKIRAALQCNLVLMTKKGTRPEMLQVSPDDQIHDKDNYEDQVLSSRPRSMSKSPTSSSKACPITRLKAFLGFQDSTQETIPSSTVIPGVTDGGSGADESDGPRKDQTVLYAERALGSRSAYLEKEEHERTMTQGVPILLSSISIRASPTAIPTQSTWLNFKGSLTTTRSNEKSKQLLHQEEVDSHTDFSTSSSGSRTPMAESQENVSLRMTPTGMVEYTSIGDSENVKKHDEDVPSP